jgi:hypothetical protein
MQESLPSTKVRCKQVQTVDQAQLCHSVSSFPFGLVRLKLIRPGTITPSPLARLVDIHFDESLIEMAHGIHLMSSLFFYLMKSRGKCTTIIDCYARTRAKPTYVPTCMYVAHRLTSCPCIRNVRTAASNAYGTESRSSVSSSPA